MLIIHHSSQGDQTKECEAGGSSIPSVYFVWHVEIKLSDSYVESNGFHNQIFQNFQSKDKDFWIELKDCSCNFLAHLRDIKDTGYTF